VGDDTAGSAVRAHTEAARECRRSAPFCFDTAFIGRDTRTVPAMLHELETFEQKTGHVRVIVETPKGRRNKYSYDTEHGLFQLKSVLPAGHVFPFDFGFIPGTVGQDGDPLDILVLMEEPASQGCLVLTRLMAVLEAEQTENGNTERNDRLIGVAANSHDYRSIESPEQLSATLMEEIEHFFISYNEMAGKQFKPIGRAGADRARELIRKGVRAVNAGQRE
jgi:inorganic pyrophosphatase